MSGIHKKVIDVFIKNRELILYLFFGVCTVVVNTVSYRLLYSGLALANIWSTALAWLFAVIFAYITNKIWVFHTKQTTLKARMKEFGAFFLCRILTGILDLVIMVIAVDLAHGNGPLWKLISNIIVTVLNYVASKFLIFT